LKLRLLILVPRFFCLAGTGVAPITERFATEASRATLVLAWLLISRPSTARPKAPYRSAVEAEAALAPLHVTLRDASYTEQSDDQRQQALLLLIATKTAVRSNFYFDGNVFTPTSAPLEGRFLPR
jgi:hypothetical protein